MPTQSNEDMSKLDETLDKVYAAAKNDPLTEAYGFIIDEAKQQIKDLVKELWNEADNETETWGEGIRVFQKKIEEL